MLHDLVHIALHGVLRAGFILPAIPLVVQRAYMSRLVPARLRRLRS
jgi:hypothetical protein